MSRKTNILYIVCVILFFHKIEKTNDDASRKEVITMKKSKVLAFIMAAAMAVAMTSCGTDTDSDSDKDNKTSVSSETDTDSEKEDTTDETDETSDTEDSTKDSDDSKKGSKKGSKSGESKDLTALSESELKDYLKEVVGEVTNYRTDMAVEMDMDFDMSALLKAQGMSAEDMTAEEKEQMEAMGIDLDEPMNVSVKVNMTLEADEDTIHTNEVEAQLGGALFGSMSDEKEPEKTEVYIDLASGDGSSYDTYTFENGEWSVKTISAAEKDEKVNSSLVRTDIIDKAKSLKAEKADNGYNVIVVINSDDMNSDSGIGETFSDMEGLEIGLILNIEDGELKGIEFDTADFLDKAMDKVSEQMKSEMGGEGMENAIKINKFDLKMSVYDIGNVSVDIPQEVLDAVKSEAKTSTDSAAA